MEEIVRASDVRHVYPDGTVVHFRGPDLVVRRGERVGLLGPNGSGKSTLLFHLMGVLHPTGGTVRVFGHDPAREFHRIQGRLGVLLQDPDEQIIAPTVRDDIAFTPLNLGYPPDEVERMVQRVAEALDIAHLLDKVPHYLSGGERLKVALAGALVTRPLLLLLDEPFEGLDTRSKSELTALLNRLRARQGVAFVISTHEVNLMPHFLDTLYLLARGGEIVAVGPPREILRRTDLLLQHHMEPPVLSALFDELRRRGLPLAESALTVEEAAALLERLLRPPVRR
ncbi:MAG TPA: ABC transporter ATP-binding protein [Chloroflexota bacterium]